jgi:hypothetical protein
MVVASCCNKYYAQEPDPLDKDRDRAWKLDLDLLLKLQARFGNLFYLI